MNLNNELVQRLADMGFESLDRLEQIQPNDLIAYYEDESHVYILKVTKPNIVKTIPARGVSSRWSAEDHEMKDTSFYTTSPYYPRITVDDRPRWLIMNKHFYYQIITDHHVVEIFETKDCVFRDGKYWFYYHDWDRNHEATITIEPGYKRYKGNIPINKCLKAPDSFQLKRALFEEKTTKNNLCPFCQHGYIREVSSRGPHASTYGGKMAYTLYLRCDKCDFEKSEEDILET